MVERINRLLARHRPQAKISPHEDSDWHVHIADDRARSPPSSPSALLGLARAFLDLGADRFGSGAVPRCRGVFIDTRATARSATAPTAAPAGPTSPPTASVSRPSPDDRVASTGGRGVTWMAQHSRDLSRVPYERLGPCTPSASTRSIGPSPPGRPCRRIGIMFVTRRTRRCRSRRCRGSGRSRWRGDPTGRSGREGEHPQAAGLGLALLFVSPRPWRPGSGGPGNAGATSRGRRRQLHRSPPRPAVQGPSRRRRTPRWPRRPRC
jgi:hypothetical protein